MVAQEKYVGLFSPWEVEMSGWIQRWLGSPQGVGGELLADWDFAAEVGRG